MNAYELAIRKGFHFGWGHTDSEYTHEIYTLRRGNVALVLVDEEYPTVHRKVRGIGGKRSGFCPFSSDVSCEATELKELGNFYHGVDSSELMLMMMLGIWANFVDP